MKKHEFLEELLRRLSQLPQEEREKAYAFYTEIIDDSMEDGAGEDEAVESLGSMDEVVQRIIADTPSALPAYTGSTRRKRAKGTVVLLILGFPVWFPLLIAAASVVLTLFIVVWVLALVLWVVFVSCAAAVAGGLIGILTVPEIGIRLLQLGGAMVCAGCAALLYPACMRITRQLAVFTRWLWIKGTRALNHRRKQTYETI